MTFTIRKYNPETGMYGEKYCPYQSPESQTCDSIEDAMEKARFAFDDAGTETEQIGRNSFRAGDEEYKVEVHAD